MKVAFTPKARQDLADIGAWIARDWLTLLDEV